jgi:hypothetical protein
MGFLLIEESINLGLSSRDPLSCIDPDRDEDLLQAARLSQPRDLRLKRGDLGFHVVEHPAHVRVLFSQTLNLDALIFNLSRLPAKIKLWLS